MKCTNKEIGKKVFEYAVDNDIDDEEIEAHILECEYCWKKVQELEKEKEELKPIENLIRTHVSEETFKEILEIPEIGEKNKQPAVVPFTLLRDNKRIYEIPITMEGFSWSSELVPGAVFALIDRKGRILLQEKIPAFLNGTLYSPFRSQIKVIPIATEDGAEKGEVTIRLEEKENGVMLTLETKEI